MNVYSLETAAAIQEHLDFLNRHITFGFRGHEPILEGLIGEEDGLAVRFDVEDGELVLARLGESW